MVAQKFGKSDPDMSSRVGKRKGTKEISDKPLPSVGSDVTISAKVGGISNRPGNKSAKKPGAS